MESNSMGSNYDDMHSDQLDNLSNLIINNGGSQGVSGGGGSGVLGAYGMGNNASPEPGDTDNMLLEQYERDLDKGINDGHISERDQCYQRLFQSFQTSACTVAQMFKDKMTTPGSTSSLNASNQQQPQQPQLTSWQSFQSSAGAITLLYKDSLEACKSHYDIGVSVGQQRKLKELITWLKKKRRRTIRKDELIGFLIGKQQHSSLANGCSPASGSTSSAGTQASLASMFMMMNPSSNSTSATTNNSTPSQQNNNVFFNGLTKHQQSTLARAANPASGSNLLSANSATCPANLANIGQANDTSSDLATFREALIMHNRSRDGPLPHSQHLQNYVNHHHHHASSNHQAPCEDLDCFFCEQIATHAEPHKRSSSFMFNGNNCDNNMESSPTRKRSRFY